MQNFRKCPICENKGGGVKPQEIYHLRMSLPEEYHLPDSYHVVSCSECGFCYADTCATISDYDHYYEKINFYAHKPETLEYSQILNRWTAIIKSIATESSYIVDMGFGDGRLLLTLKENGFNNLVGIDTTSEGVRLLRERGIAAYESSVYDEPIREIAGKADILIMSGVFEHLLLPNMALSNVKKWLKIGGKLLCLVPNMDNLATTELPISYFFHHEHINYFTRDSLRYFMAKEGYKEVEAYSQFDEYGNIVSVFEYLGDAIWRESEDFTGYRKLKAYFERETEKDCAKHRLIEKLVKNKEPIILYGCGSLLQKMWAETNLCEGNIVALVDKNPIKVRDMNIEGFAIISPKQLAKEKLKGKICVFCAKGSESILRDIRELNIQNEILVV